MKTRRKNKRVHLLKLTKFINYANKFPNGFNLVPISYSTEKGLITLCFYSASPFVLHFF